MLVIMEHEYERKHYATGSFDINAVSGFLKAKIRLISWFPQQKGQHLETKLGSLLSKLYIK
jgi:hypothetical protein